MIRRWIVYVAALLGCIVFYVAYQQWMAWLLLMAVVWLPAVSVLLSLPAMLTARLSMGKNGAIPLGTKAPLQTKASCPLPMPAYLCRIRVNRTLTGETWLIYPGDSLPTDHCSQLLCRMEKSRVYDYLGLFHLKLRGCEQIRWLVRPVPLPVKVPQNLERHIAQAWRPKFGGGFAENHELRLYRPGDSMNQVHWKLSAKTGKLIIREAMEPVSRRLVLSVDINGTPEELDRKFGRLLWMGTYLLNQGLRFEIHALTDHGLQFLKVSSEPALENAIDTLLQGNALPEGSVVHRNIPASWRYHIGGEPDET